MKTLVVLAALVSGIAFAATPPLPSFQSEKLPVPPLSLRDALKSQPSATRPLVNPTETPLRFEPKAPRFFSRMPMVVPGTRVDERMPVKKANPDIDPKIIKQPELEVRK